MLGINNLNKVFKKKEILSKISCEFTEGQIFTILGANGSGRTTLFECISGDLSFEDGNIIMEDGKIAILANNRSLLPMNLTGYQFLQYVSNNVYAEENNLVKNEVDEVDEVTEPLKIDVDEVADLVKIDEKMRHMLIKEYDFRTKRKLQLAMLIILRPYVMMFDEPFDYCDNEYIDDFLEVLNIFKDDHIIMISTGLYDIAKKISGDVMVLSNGQLNYFDKDGIKNKYTKKVIIDLIGEDEDV